MLGGRARGDVFLRESFAVRPAPRRRRTGHAHFNTWVARMRRLVGHRLSSRAESVTQPATFLWFGPAPNLEAIDQEHRLPMRRLGAVMLALIVCALASLSLSPSLLSAIAVQTDPLRADLRSSLAAPAFADLRAGYAARGYRPLWFRQGRLAPEAVEVVQRLAESDADDLHPQAYGATSLAARLRTASSSSPAVQVMTDLLLTKSFVRFVSDLHAPATTVSVYYVDPALRAPVRTTTADIFAVMSAAPSLAAGVNAATRMNPLYEAYRRAAMTEAADPALRERLMINLERLRALPIYLGRRYVLVDAATARLWMYQDDRPVDEMKVVVGKLEDATPMLAGVIRYAIFNPRWNIPPDLVRQVYAPRIRADSRVLDNLHLDPWSDYTDQAHRLDPTQINWSQVQSDAVSIGLRQRPGPWNAMGRAKFMLPNELGIYLHDTPDKALFQKSRRTFSAGCVRLENYQRLAVWLLGPARDGTFTGEPDHRIDLPRPTPVYITYLTVAPRGGRLIGVPDIYARDASKSLSGQVRGRLTFGTHSPTWRAGA